jgi:hypothetical protein
MLRSLTHGIPNPEEVYHQGRLYHSFKVETPENAETNLKNKEKNNKAKNLNLYSTVSIFIQHVK